METGAAMTMHKQMPRFLWPWMALAALFALPLHAHAQQIALALDPAKTQVEFTLDAFLHTVHGTMKLTQGAIEIDTATGEASGRMVVDARSANTGNDGRDSRMHKEILESQKYPEIVFSPKRVEGQITLQGKSRAQLRGIISIHGSEHEIITPVDVQITGDEWTGETTFPVPYVKWGIKSPNTLFLRVKDTVDLTVRAAGRLSTRQP
jgi:polyisoprenoid-binding protein YceI